MKHWSYDSIFYHIYPLGFCGAPERNDFNARPVTRLDKLYRWLDHLQGLGVNALYLGPLFESSGHGYDTADFYHVDRRLGDDATLTSLSQEIHRRGMRLILDGVFNHVGRDFWAFRDVRQHGEQSMFCGWFDGLQFGAHSPYNDPFTYRPWNGHYELVKLNLSNPWVREHLFGAVESWVRDYEIDGLRLDVADQIDPGFLTELSRACRRLKSDFWLLGEAIHGNYRRLANPEMLDATTNYELYKSLYSSHNDRNYFELAYALNRQFGEGGLYRDMPLYNFADNHDVDRVASRLKEAAHLYPLYLLLFTMPGIPSIYYGSEWGIQGKRSASSDRALRPSLDLQQVGQSSSNRDLLAAIRRFAGIRTSSPALKWGSYQQNIVRSEQFIFTREWKGEKIVVAVNASSQACSLDLRLPGRGRWVDLLDPEQNHTADGEKIFVEIPPYWGRVMKSEDE